MSSSISSETGRSPILDAFRDELIDAVELGAAAVDQLLMRWCQRYPVFEEAFRRQARVVVLLWGLREPERLGPYQLLSILAYGGMGKIYRAKEDLTGRIVAVKTVLAGHLSPAEQIGRFETERRLLSRAYDTHIVPLLATSQEGPILYFAMPFIPGVTLAALIAASSAGDAATERYSGFAALFGAASRVESSRRRAASNAPGGSYLRKSDALSKEASASAPRRDLRPSEYLGRVVQIMEQVAGAVQHLHEIRILHRDLKPSNIMIESSGHAWVIDLGVGRDLTRADEGDPAEPSPAHPSGAITRGVGTLSYMAPEQISERFVGPGERRAVPQDARIDVWGLGATLYELITLRVPFEGASDVDVARRIVNDPLTPPRVHFPSIARELESVCLKALRKDPADRYPSAAAFAADLRSWTEGRPTQAGHARADERIVMWTKRHPAVAVALGLMLAVLFFVGIVAAQYSRRNLERAHAAIAQTRAAANVTQAQLDLANQRAKANQQQLALLSIQRLRGPNRVFSWFQDYIQRIRVLSDGGLAGDPLLQGQAAAALEGTDARIVKTVYGRADVVAFDRRSNRLLMNRRVSQTPDAVWTRTTIQGDLRGEAVFAHGIPHEAALSQTAIWDPTSDEIVVQQNLGAGVFAVPPGGEAPLQLSWVTQQPSGAGPCNQLILSRVGSELGPERPCQRFRSPLGLHSEFRMIALAQQAIRLAAVVCPAYQDGARVVIEREASTIAVWEVDSRWDGEYREPVRLIRHKATEGLTIAPDGRLLAAWDRSGEITIWTLPDGQELRRFRIGWAPISCMSFGPDPVWHEDSTVPAWLLAVGESSGLISIWDLSAHRIRSLCRGSEFGVGAMDFSDDGMLLLSAGRVPAKVWDVATGTCILDLRVGDHYNAVAFAPDGRQIALASDIARDSPSPAVTVLRLEPGHGIQTLHGLQGVVEKSAVSPDGRLIAGASHEWSIGIWEHPSGRLRGVLPGPVGRYADSIGMAFDREGRRFACSVGHEAKLWDIPERRLIGRWDLPEGLCDRLAFPDSNHLYLVRQENKSREGGPFPNPFPAERYPRVVRVYDLLSATPTRPLAEIDAFPRHVHDIKIASDGSLFAVDGLGFEQGRTVRRFQVYEAPTGNRLRGFPSNYGEAAVRWFFFDPSVKTLSVPMNQDLTDAMLFGLPSLEYRGATQAQIACLSPGAKYSMNVLSDLPQSIGLYDVSTGRPVLRVALDVEARQLSMNFSPDGRYAVVGRGDGTLSVLDLVEVNERLTALGLGWQVPQ